MKRLRGKVVMGVDSIQAARSMPNYSGRTKLPLSLLVYSFAKLILYFKLVSMQSKTESKNSGYPILPAYLLYALLHRTLSN